MGFLAKDEEFIRVYTESNDKAEAWEGQGRMSLRNVSIDSLPEALMNAFETSADGRISETRYVRNLNENHSFTKEVDSTGSGFTKRIYKETIEKVIETFLEEYENDFYQGYHWNCKVIKHVHQIVNHYISWDDETQHEGVYGYTEGKKKLYYTTKYERNPVNREVAICIHGTKSMICGFDFEEKYGELGKGYIEVYHTKPLAELEEEIVIDPVTDLICVCSNCHRMLYIFKKYIVTIEELKQILEYNE
ncbi:MAG: hypothetical protein K2M73_01890 [Lachnospiraceae bacterium]|nr:hypothetical protein [Lachnospiraceae bacterium]